MATVEVYATAPNWIILAVSQQDGRNFIQHHPDLRSGYNPNRAGLGRFSRRSGRHQDGPPSRVIVVSEFDQIAGFTIDPTDKIARTELWRLAPHERTAPVEAQLRSMLQHARPRGVVVQVF